MSEKCSICGKEINQGMWHIDPHDGEYVYYHSTDCESKFKEIKGEMMRLSKDGVCVNCKDGIVEADLIGDKQVGLECPLCKAKYNNQGDLIEK